MELHNTKNPSSDSFQTGTQIMQSGWKVVKVNDNRTGAQHDEDIAIDDSLTSPYYGYIYVAWSDGRNLNPVEDTYIARSTNGGKSFEPSVKVNDDNGHYAVEKPAIAVNKSGVVYVAYRSGRNDWGDIYVAKSVDGGRSWLPSVKVSDDTTGNEQLYPAIAIDKVSDTIYVAWSDWRNGNTDIYFSRSTDGGATWETNKKLNDDMTSYHQYRVALAVSNNGTLYAVWKDDRNYYGDDLYFTRSFNRGVTFSQNIQINDVANSTGGFPSIGAWGNSNVIIAWSDNRNAATTSTDAYIAISNDSGTTFGPNKKVNDEVGNTYPSAVQYQTACAVNRFGYISVAWDDNRSNLPLASSEIFATHSTDGGNTFSINEKASDNRLTSTTGLPKIAINDTLEVIAFYGLDATTPESVDSYEVYVAVRDIGMPSILSTQPGNNTINVPLNANIMVVFSEPMNISSIIFNSTPDPGGWNVLWSQNNTIATFTHNPFAQNTTYRFHILNGTDIAGNPLKTGIAPNPFIFTTILLPDANLTSPNGGESWSGGSQHPIVWSIFSGRPPYKFWLNYSVNGGITFPYPITNGTQQFAGGNIYPWNTPRINSTGVSVKIEVIDSVGTKVNDTSNSSFKIDSDPPTVMAVNPTNNTANVSTSTTISATFSEPMNRTATEAAFSISGPGTPTLMTPSWNGNTLTFSSSGLLFLSTYIITIETAARDCSEPGNGLTSQYQWQFTTSPGPLDHFYIAPIPGIQIAGSSFTITITAKDSLNNTLTNYKGSVTLSDTTGTLTPNNSGPFSNGTRTEMVTITKAQSGITITAAASGKIGTSNIFTVVPAALNKIVITPGSVTITVDQTMQFTAMGHDSYNNTVQIAPSWSATNGTVNNSGFYIPWKTGTWTVYANQSGISGNASITVSPGVLAKIVVLPSAVSMSAGQSQQFNAKGYDAKDNEISITPVWAVNGGGTISGTGLFSASTLGNWLVYANQSGISGTANITVAPGALAKIVVSPASATINADQTQRFTATGYDAFDNPVTISPAWTVAGSGTITQSGLYTPNKAGTWKVYANQSGVSGTATINVTPGVLRRIMVFPPITMLLVGETRQFIAVGEDAKGNNVPFSPTWGVNGGGTIDSSGQFNAAIAGTWTVYANHSGISGTATVIVSKPPQPLAIKLISPNGGENWTIGSKQKILWSAAGGNGTLRINFEYSFSGPSGPYRLIAQREPNDGVYDWMIPRAPSTNCYVRATVIDADGKTANDTSDSAFIIGYGVLARVNITPAIVYIETNKSQQFDAKGFDTFGNEIPGLRFTWSVSNAALGAITDTGLFTAGSIINLTGFVNATSSYGGSTKTGTAEIHITGKLKLHHVLVQPQTANLTARQKQDFAAQGYTADNKPIGGLSYSWHVIPEILGTLSASNLQLVTFTAGTANITGKLFVNASDGTDTASAYAEITVTVPKPGVKVIKPNGGELFYVGAWGAIEWTTSGGVGDLRVKLEYSTTGKDGVFSLIAENIYGNYFFGWRIPYVHSTNCYVKITVFDELNQTASDISDRPFTIALPQGSIYGTVRDSYGTPIPNATLSIYYSQNKTFIKSITTDRNGNYSFSGLYPSMYMVIVSKSGYITAFKNVTIDISQLNVRVDITLSEEESQPPPPAPEKKNIRWAVIVAAVITVIIAMFIFVRQRTCSSCKRFVGKDEKKYRCRCGALYHKNCAVRIKNCLRCFKKLRKTPMTK